MSANQIQTITIPYVPLIGDELPTTATLAQRVTPETFARHGEDIKDWELREIQGKRLVLVDGEWSDHGHVAIYRRIFSAQKPN